MWPVPDVAIVLSEDSYSYMGTWATSSWCGACLCAPQGVLRALDRFCAHFESLVCPCVTVPLRKRQHERKQSHKPHSCASLRYATIVPHPRI